MPTKQVSEAFSVLFYMAAARGLNRALRDLKDGMCVNRALDEDVSVTDIEAMQKCFRKIRRADEQQVADLGKECLKIFSAVVREHAKGE